MWKLKIDKLYTTKHNYITLDFVTVKLQLLKSSTHIVYMPILTAMPRVRTEKQRKTTNKGKESKIKTKQELCMLTIHVHYACILYIYTIF